VRSFEIATDLAAPPEAVWQRVTTPRGINDELLPLVRMTTPPALRGVTIGDVPVGESLGRSWLLMFGLVPVEFDDLTIAELEPGRRFLERSAMLTQSEWRHERIVEPHRDGCRVTDRLAWQGRWKASEVLYGLVVPVLFRHRHRRLRRGFGAA
jgi:ligand-binding SRPBCC domain-containing protein